MKINKEFVVLMLSIYIFLVLSISIISILKKDYLILSKDGRRLSIVLNFSNAHLHQPVDEILQDSGHLRDGSIIYDNKFNTRCMELLPGNYSLKLPKSGEILNIELIFRSQMKSGEMNIVISSESIPLFIEINDTSILLRNLDNKSIIIPIDPVSKYILLNVTSENKRTRICINNDALNDGNTTCVDTKYRDTRYNNFYFEIQNVNYNIEYISATIRPENAQNK